MSKFRKSFNDIYNQLWDILDKPKLSFTDRQRSKQLLNQLFREHYFGKWYKPLKFNKRECKENEQLKKEAESDQLALNESKEIIAELKAQNKTILEDNDTLNKWIDELKAQIEKMKSFIHSKIDFCMYCPLTKECRNNEGTCPYACATEEEQKNLLMDFIQKMGV